MRYLEAVRGGGSEQHRGPGESSGKLALLSDCLRTRIATVLVSR